MAAAPKRTTVYLDAELHKALQLKSIAVSKSISYLVNKAVRDSLKKDRQKYNTILGLMSEPGLEVKPKPMR